MESTKTASPTHALSERLKEFWPEIYYASEDGFDWERIYGLLVEDTFPGLDLNASQVVIPCFGESIGRVFAPYPPFLAAYYVDPWPIEELGRMRRPDWKALSAQKPEQYRAALIEGVAFIPGYVHYRLETSHDSLAKNTYVPGVLELVGCDKGVTTHWLNKDDANALGNLVLEINRQPDTRALLRRTQALADGKTVHLPVSGLSDQGVRLGIRQQGKVVYAARIKESESLATGEPVFIATL